MSRTSARAPSRAAAVIASFVFFWLAPGTVAGLIPYLLSGWQFAAPLGGIGAGRVLGALLAVVALVALIDSFVRFAWQGRGTPAPIMPTDTLVVSGLYRYVRNPMYVSVVKIIAGQALLFGSIELAQYAAVVWLAFHLFVLVYEEPTLRARYGASYDIYRGHVRRWLPRLTPWHPA